MARLNENIIDPEEGWAIIYQFIVKIRGLLEEGERSPLKLTEEYLTCTRVIYDMCRKRDRNYSRQLLYDRYRSSFEDYITSMVVPDLMQRQGELLLRELVRRWEIHKDLVRFVSNLFQYLDRYYIPKHSLRKLTEVGRGCFKDLVFSNEMRINAYRNEVNSLIDRERHGEEIDRALFENVKGLFVELGIHL